MGPSERTEGVEMTYCIDIKPKGGGEAWLHCVEGWRFATREEAAREAAWLNEETGSWAPNDVYVVAELREEA